jgi:acrylyl-CoA reductase (NADPH)
VIDAVGSHTLANACAQVRYGGAVAACGLAQGHELPATVMPFILRGVSLLGVDSVMAPLALRREAWGRLARDLDLAALDRLSTEIGLDEALAASSCAFPTERRPHRPFRGAAPVVEWSCGGSAAAVMDTAGPWVVRAWQAG